MSAGANKDISTLARICLRYGVLGAAASAPFACLVVALPIMLIIEVQKELYLPSLPLFLFASMSAAFIAWTFILPGLVSVFLLMAARSARHDEKQFLSWFFRAYRLMRIGCVFSFMPFFVMSGLGFLMATPPSHWTMRGLFNVSVVLLWSPSLLAIGYYVVFFRLRRIRKLFVDHPIHNLD